MEDIDPIYLDEYVAMAGDPDAAAAAISCFEPAERPDLNAGLIGSRLEFTTTDLDGNPVSSADLFAQNDITLVNFWAVWCGPCLGELEDLQAIHRNMQQKGVGVAGLLLDDYVEEAPAILEEYGVTYPVVLMPDLDGLITLEGYPTTVFVSSYGTVLAGPVAGADVGRYHTILNDLLRKK
jgi:thiol-disulfide isomerase/thioredoxin